MSFGCAVSVEPPYGLNSVVLVAVVGSGGLSVVLVVVLVVEVFALLASALINSATFLIACAPQPERHPSCELQASDELLHFNQRAHYRQAVLASSDKSSTDK